MTGDYRKALHQNIDAIANAVVRLAAMVEDALARATAALLAGDLEAAQLLIENDDELDALSIDIEDHCFRILALESPLAVDLRTVVASMRINTDVERAGDLMANVAKGTRRLQGVVLPPRLRGLLQQMSDEAARLLRLAVDAYRQRDGTLGGTLDRADDVLDVLHAEFVQGIFETHNAGELTLQAAVQLALIARFYERVGDHAVNIGVRVQFIADGQLPEHIGAKRARERAQRAAS